MRTIRLDVAYEGTDFHGWQAQPGHRTVQGVLEECLEVVLKERVRLAAAGRTDAGCHARGQVASFRTRSRLPVRAMAPALRRHLPRDLHVYDAGECRAGFDARRCARARRYAYRLLDRPDVLLARVGWHARNRPEPESLSRSVTPLEGAHDCAAFAASGSTARRTACVIHRASWRRWEGGLLFDVIADHFLYHMVRNLVGTALVAARLADPAAEMRRVLCSRDRGRAGPTAPAHGLCLEEVFYGEWRA